MKKDSSAQESTVWANLATAPNVPGLAKKGTYPTNPDGVDVMLEQWDAGTEEPPHSHPGDDMTVVIEGSMSVRFYTKSGDGLVPDGPELVLTKGDTGYIKAGRVHDAKYTEACKLVYVHAGAFGFIAVTDRSRDTSGPALQ
jgi:quercetin dioxygenase-like cupin family protein